VLLLVLTAVDYALWDWSIADGHDIVSLVAGLTLLPLAGMSLGGLVLVGARVLGLLLGRPVGRARAGHAAASRGAGAEHEPTASASEPKSPSGRLAA
jgi:hypothetical protein